MAGLGWHNVLQQGKYTVATLATLATEVQAGADMASLASGQPWRGGAGGDTERSNPHCNNTSTAVKS